MANIDSEPEMETCNHNPHHVTCTVTCMQLTAATGAEIMDLIALPDVVRSDYSPFPSKLFFLLYVLVNSPHPLVSIVKESNAPVLLLQGESNLTFVFSILKNTNIVVPSLSTIKRFQLPTFTPPERVRTF